MQDIINRVVLDPIIDKKVVDENFEKSETEMESDVSKKVLKYPQDYNSDFPIVFFGGLNGKTMNDPRV